MSIVALFVMLAVVVMPTSIFAQSDMMCETYNEAPELAERVAAGELPPVEEDAPPAPVRPDPRPTPSAAKHPLLRRRPR